MALNPISRDNTAALMPEDAAREIIKALPQQSSVLSLPNVRRRTMSRKQQRLPIISMLPDAYWVTEGNAKQQTAAAWTNKFITADELAVIVAIHENVLDDADYDLWGEIQPLLIEAIGQKIDQAVLFGTDSPATQPDSIVEDAVAAGNVVNDGDGQVDFAQDINLAFAEVESDGFMVNGAVARVGVKHRLRGLRDENNQPIFVTSLQDDGRVQSIYGEPLAWNTNGAWDPDAAELIVGDWSQLFWATRTDIRVKISSEATVGGVSLFETDQVALRVTFRGGFQVANPPTRENPDDDTRFPWAVLAPATSESS